MSYFVPFELDFELQQRLGADGKVEFYLTQKDKSPKKASSAVKAAIWGVGAQVVLSIISIIISSAMISSMY